MDKDKAIKLIEQLMNYGLAPEEARWIAERELQAVEESQRTGKILNQLKGTAEIGLNSLVSVLNFLASPGYFAGAAAGGSFLVYLWGREQQNKFLREFKQQVNERIDEKLEQSRTLDLDEFMELFTQAMEIASKSASELKRQALARALVNSVVPPTNQVSGKQALLRVLAQISDEEMLALTALYKHESVADELKKFAGISINELVVALDWSESETLVACEGLRQLGLVYDPRVGTWNYMGRDSQQFEACCITALGNKLLIWSQGQID